MEKSYAKQSILNRLDSAVDPESLLTLKNLVGDGFPDLLKRFLGDCDKHIAEIKQALHDQRWADLYETAHSLKGSSGTLSALHLASHCQRLEGEVLVAQNGKKMQLIVKELEAELQRVRYVLEQYVCVES